MHRLERRVLLPHDLRDLRDLNEYIACGGLSGLKKAKAMDRKAVIAEVKKSGLRGRGGAGFPTGVKWETVANAPDLKKFVVCNFAEGEPGTYKDRYLILKNPYIVLEGMLIASYAVNATQAIIGTKEKFKKTGIPQRLQSALKEMEDAGVVDKGLIRIVLGPDDYLFGEEKALLEVIDGRGAMPRLFPPFLVGVGCGPNETNPTVVNNAESMSHLPHILSKGVDWFRTSGNEDTPGTMIFAISGDVKRQGMFEVPLGLTVRELLYDLCEGPVSADRPFKALFSGVANRVMTPDQFDLKMDFGTLRTAGVGLGSGGFMIYDQSRSMVEAATLFSHFLAFSSCGQCVPCNSGTKQITEHLYDLMDGHGSEDDIDSILDICGRCTSQTRCFLPTQESILVKSIIDKFPQEFKERAKSRAPLERTLLIPKIEYFDDANGQFTFEAHPREFSLEEKVFPGTSGVI